MFTTWRHFSSSKSIRIFCLRAPVVAKHQRPNRGFPLAAHCDRCLEAHEFPWAVYKEASIFALVYFAFARFLHQFSDLDAIDIAFRLSSNVISSHQLSNFTRNAPKT